MLNKEVVSQAVIQDLGVCDSQKKQIDPRTKMQMRHMQVGNAGHGCSIGETNDFDKAFYFLLVGLQIRRPDIFISEEKTSLQFHCVIF